MPASFFRATPHPFHAHAQRRTHRGRRPCRPVSGDFAGASRLHRDGAGPKPHRSVGAARPGWAGNRPHPPQRSHAAAPGHLGGPGAQRDRAHPHRRSPRRPRGRALRHAIARVRRVWPGPRRHGHRPTPPAGLHRAQPCLAPHGLPGSGPHPGCAHHRRSAGAPRGRPGHPCRGGLCPDHPTRAAQRAPVRPPGGCSRQPLFCRPAPIGHWCANDRLWAHRHRLPHAPHPAPWRHRPRVLWLRAHAGRATAARCRRWRPRAVLRGGDRPGRRRRPHAGAGECRFHGRSAGPVPKPTGRHGAAGRAPRLPAGGRVRTALHWPTLRAAGRCGGGHAPRHRPRLQPGAGRGGAADAGPGGRPPAWARLGRRSSAGALCAGPPPACLAHLPGHQRHRAPVHRCAPPAPCSAPAGVARRAAPAAAQGGHRGPTHGKAPRWQAPLAQLGNALAAARPRG